MGASKVASGARDGVCGMAQRMEWLLLNGLPSFISEMEAVTSTLKKPTSASASHEDVALPVALRRLRGDSAKSLLRGSAGSARAEVSIGQRALSDMSTRSPQALRPPPKREAHKHAAARTPSLRLPDRAPHLALVPALAPALAPATAPTTTSAAAC